LNRPVSFYILTILQGYSKEMLDDLRTVSKYPSVEQLHYLLTKMLDRKDTTRSDIIERTNSIVKGGYPGGVADGRKQIQLLFRISYKLTGWMSEEKQPVYCVES
jgi:hypothetical protein